MRGVHAVPVPRGTTGSRRLDWRLTLKLAVSAGLLGLLFTQADAASLWTQFRTASPLWIGVALLLYFAMIAASAWRWGELLVAQDVSTSWRALVDSYLVATFFNNFLPSNIGGDVIRIKDTVAPAGSRTIAAAVVLLDRGIGLLGLLLIAAVGATVLSRHATATLPVGPLVLWTASVAGILGLSAVVARPAVIERLFGPLKRLHARWVEAGLRRLVDTFARFRARPRALFNCLAGAVVVQGILVAFYAAVALSLRIPIPLAHLAVLVPLSFVAQMLPVSMNGFGVREATFTAYFAMLDLPLESALALSLLGTATIMLFSLSGAAVYAARR